MRFSNLTISILLVAAATGATAATTCSNGISGVEKSGACCSAACGTCGGSGCGTRNGLSGDECCTSTILKDGPLCSASGKAPCIVDGGSTTSTTSDSKCSNGISGVEKSGACCSAACGTCGGSGCGTRNGLSGDECCTSTILEAGPLCSASGKAPCIVDGGSTTPTTSDSTCSNGISGVEKSGACCSAACGTCGGSGCGTRNGLSGDECCTSTILEAGPLCSASGKAPCIVDGGSPTPTAPTPTPPTPTPPTPTPSGCSKKATIEFKGDIVYVKGGGCATLSDIYYAQSVDGPLYVLDSSNKKVSGAGKSATPTGYWLQTANIFVYDDVTLFVKGQDHGGDCNVLRIQSTSSKFWEIRGHGGSLYFEGTTVTSWDTDKGKEREYTGSKSKGRSFIRCITEYDDSDIYSCEGASSKDMGTCRMDIIYSTIGNLGYYSSESYGLVWKVRGLCTEKLENLDIFEKRQVYGDIKNSDIYGNYYGMYTYGHQGGVWTNNKMHHNVQYGFDPHDDSDYLTIANNEVYNNGNHGIIASKRCNNVKIYGNEVYNGDQVGIMLHRSSDDAEVYDNYVHDNADAGIAFFESFGGNIHDNKVERCAFGIRLSLGSGDNLIKDNTFDDMDRYGLYTYKGTDSPDASKDGRPTGNVFDGNTVKNVDVGVQIKDSDDNVFKNNVFSNVKTFEFPSSTDTTWTGNSIGSACIEEKADFASGSIPMC